ncbi:ABC transporter ATP-binding protein [Anaerolineae bacterium CFX7]|nr:ABC transporter ATP-binding protein [Anaerolineae bacterium CFX7]
MLRRKLLIGLATALVLAFGASQVFAGVMTFNVVVPRLGGYSTSNVTTITVGANKPINFQPYKGNGAVGSSVTATTGQNINAPFNPNQAIGSLIYLRLYTQWNELVAVQVRGTFNSN